MQQLSAPDAAFVYSEKPTARNQTASLHVCDMATAPNGRLDFDQVVAHVEKRLDRVPSFRRRLVRVPFDLDLPYWVDDEHFDVEYHVREIALPAPGDWHQLCTQVARLHSRPLDMTRPLWELYVIQGVEAVEGVPEGSFALLIRLHHAALDGISGNALLSALLDDSLESESGEAPSGWTPQPEPSPQALLTRAVLNNARSPSRLLRWARLAVPGVARMVAGVGRAELHLPAMTAPTTILNGTISPHRVVEGRRFDFDAIRRVRRGVDGATVNDVMLALVGGAMREYLMAKDALPERPLLAIAPISLRAEGDDVPGNRIAGMGVSLATNVPDPLDRLAAVHASTVDSKALLNAVGAKTLTEMSDALPGALFGLASRLQGRIGTSLGGRPLFNTVVSNVPGPQKPLSFAGSRVLTFFGMAPIQDGGQTTVHAVESYCGKLDVMVVGDRRLLPDAPYYADCLQHSYEVLVATG